jgi:hypothetical protein
MNWLLVPRAWTGRSLDAAAMKMGCGAHINDQPRADGCKALQRARAFCSVGTLRSIVCDWPIPNLHVRSRECFIGHRLRIYLDTRTSAGSQCESRT